MIVALFNLQCIACIVFLSHLIRTLHSSRNGAYGLLDTYGLGNRRDKMILFSFCAINQRLHCQDMTCNVSKNFKLCRLFLKYSNSVLRSEFAKHFIYLH